MERCQKRAEIRQSDEDYDEEEEEVQAEAAERDDEARILKSTRLGVFVLVELHWLVGMVVS
jgi:hypothetical protein